MSSRFLSRSIAVAAAGALVASCTMNSQDPPPLGGPSEFGQSVVVAVNPDSLPQDGASQSLVTVTVRDADSRPLRNVTLRVETRVDNTPVDFGSLSARSIVTGADGRATFMYTAPSSPAMAVDAFTIVDIGATPIGTDFNNAVLRTAAIRLTVPGIIVPPGDMTASFTMTPSAPLDGQTVLFDASASRGSIVDYQWDFGDGARSSGRTASHAYRSPGTYVVRLTLADPYGRQASAAQSITVGAAQNPVALFVFSPTPVRVGATVNFNGSGSRPAAGNSLSSYTWDFGDGTRTTTGGPEVSKVYGAAGVYQVTLYVTDSSGRVSPTATQAVTVTVTP
jgi:PKD repeat protein